MFDPVAGHGASITGFGPHDRTPGLWLTGNLVTTPVTDWSFTDRSHNHDTDADLVSAAAFGTHRLPRLQWPALRDFRLSAGHSEKLERECDARPPRTHKNRERFYDRTLTLVTDPAESSTCSRPRRKNTPAESSGECDGTCISRRRLMTVEEKGSCMKIVITGANSAVGQAILRCGRHKRPHRIRLSPRSAPTAPPNRSAPQLSSPNGVVRISYEDPGSLDAAFQGASAVIHLAGILVERPGSTYEQANVASTRSVVEAAKRARCRRSFWSAQREPMKPLATATTAPRGRRRLWCAHRD